MNEHIEELIEQADIDIRHIEKHADEEFSDRLEKFAKLIVQQCCKVVDAGKYPGVNQVPAEVALDMTAKNIKAYFGVE